ncbi:MAG: endonuclease VIII [Gammaproteobacteria bacterium]|nr:MAG: endonuclease VIII [Gammaproteobacteria bacterium]
MASGPPDRSADRFPVPALAPVVHDARQHHGHHHGPVPLRPYRLNPPLPEGPEIRRLRNRLAEAIEGETAQRIEFHLPRLTEWNGRLDGCHITAIESRGKALLTHIDSGHSIYSHNQLYGRWFVVPPGEPPDTRRQLRLAIHTRRYRALLYSASDIEVWPTDQLSEHPFLKRLGPDVLDETTTTAMVLERLRDKAWWRRRLGGFLTDQSFVAGLGNYLRCEILFVAGLHPNQRPCDLDELQLSRISHHPSRNRPLFVA